MSEFEKLGIDEDFNQFYVEHEIKSPNQVQKKVIPKIMNNQSLICVAQTGSGKTLSYALPISELIKCHEDENGLSQKRGKPFAVLVLPTKELALQVSDVFKAISHHVKLRVRTLVGTNKSIKDQSFEILISTPTKLARAVKSGEVSFQQLKYLVFDEADNLFEMGFKKDIDKIMHTVEYSQTDIHFFSATMPIEVEDYLMQKFAKKKLEKVFLGSSHQVQGKIETFNIFIDDSERLQMLKLFLEKSVKGRGIVFCNQKNQVEDAIKFVNERLPKIKIKPLHGDMPEKERLACIKSFQDKKFQVLLATDVVARGIDIKDVQWVLNYNLPKTPIYYLHRGGRTARAGKSGQVFNFVSKYDSQIVAAINESIRNQSKMNLDLLKANDFKEKRPIKKKKKTKQKRVKITKRTKAK
ncbi:MAG: hypothetical protein CME62_15250 [Halobacteriovoraceae bacterium]|nr:hypothetical protein [Halobacteriovoraceae bacterium]|tara:strand:- start:21156 stop:22388 length:1233 start_codon:yes stop_codon:yes gene_type:complete